MTPPDAAPPGYDPAAYWSARLSARAAAESAGWSAFRGREFAPGAPRTVFVGAEVEL